MGFDIKTFTNSQFNSPVTSGLYIGAELYVEVSWELKAADNLRFVVYNCFADVSGIQIDIVDKSCYAETLGAEFLGVEKAVSVTSRFKYQMFAPRSSALTISTTLTCTLHICLSAPDTCSDHIVTESENCPQRTPNLLNFRV